MPLTAPLRVTAADVLPLHSDCPPTVFTVAVGLTVILNVLLLPVQLLAEGVTTMAATTGDDPVLLAVKLAILPVPVPAIPIEPAELVQL